MLTNQQKKNRNSFAKFILFVTTFGSWWTRTLVLGLLYGFSWSEIMGHKWRISLVIALFSFFLTIPNRKYWQTKIAWFLYVLKERGQQRKAIRKQKREELRAIKPLKPVK